MYWSLVFCVIFFVAPTNEQRRAIVHYPSISPKESEPVSENPLSSSINSIQTGREELIGYHRSDTGSGGTYRRGNPKTTTPDYPGGSFPKGDSLSTGKVQHGTEPTEPDAKADDGQRKSDGDKVEGSKTLVAPAENRRDGGTVVFKDKRSSGFESPSTSTVKPSDRDQSGAEKSSTDGAKGSMDIGKGTPVRDHDHRTSSHESRRQTTTPSSLSNARFNTSVREGSDRNRDELSEKSRHERINRERRPSGSTETARGQRTGTRSTSEKGQVLTHTPVPRVPDTHRYDRTEHASVSAGSNDRKAPDRPVDGRDSFRNVGEEKKDLDGDQNLRSKVYPAENEGKNSTVINKPTHLLIGEEKLVPASGTPEIYSDEFTRGNKDGLNGKVGSDTEKSSVEGKIYTERPYIRDGNDERSAGHRGRDADRDYTRRHKDDRYDERPYDERSLKDDQVDRDKVRNTTYNSQDRTGNRSSRPTDLAYDVGYRDDGYAYRDVAKDDDNLRNDKTRSGRRPYTSSSEDVHDRDRHASDGTRSYREYSDDRRYRDERVPVDRDGTRRHRDEDTPKYRDDDSRAYDDYEDTDRYHDDYNHRYDKDGESRSYADSSTRRYISSGSRRYDGDEDKRSSTAYDRATRRYKDESDYTYNDTHKYRDDYDGYRDEYRRSSGDSGGSRRYDERDGTRDIHHDDEDYKGSRGYSTRDDDHDRRYIRRNNEGTSRRRESTRKYAADETHRQRGEDDDRRYRDDTRVYGESSPRDKYDQDNKRTYEGRDSTAYVEPPLYHVRSETNTRKEYDDINRQRENNGSGRSRVEDIYHNPPYEEEYYDNRTSGGSVDRYDESYRPGRKTGDNSSTLVASDVDNRKYTSRSSDERRRDRDRVYLDTSSRTRPSDSDNTRKDSSRVHDEDHYSDRSRGDSYDERVYRGRYDDEYVRSSRDRVRDYDAHTYRESDDEADTRRAKGDEDLNVRYAGDDRDRDRTVDDDEHKKTHSSGGRRRDKDYVDRRYEDRYRDESSDGSYRYREEDERHRYPTSEDRRVDHKDTDRRNRGRERFRDDYDTSYDRNLNTPRSTDERHIGSDRSNTREDRYIGTRDDFDENAPERASTKIVTARRDDAKSESPSSRNDESLLKGERRDPYDDEHRVDGKRSQARDIPTDVRIPKTQYTSRSDDLPQKPSASQPRPDSLDKGDFARGRRTSFYSDEDKIDSDRHERVKGLRDENRPLRAGESKESSFPVIEKNHGSTYETRDTRQSDRSSSRPNVEGRTYSNRRESSETTRHKPKDAVPVSRVSSDLLPGADDPEYSETVGDTVKSVISHSGEDTQRRRYSTTSSYDRGTRRRLPSVREPDMDRPGRRDEPVDLSLPENRGGYRYTKSRGDREDFSRDAQDGSFAVGDEYRGKSSTDDRRDTPKGEYGRPGSGTPTRSKEDRVPLDPTGHSEKDEYYPSSRDKIPSRSGKTVDDSRAHRDYDRREKVIRDRDSIGRDERGMYDKDEHPRSTSRDDEKFREENITSDHFETSSEEVRVNREGDPTFLVVSQAAAVTRGQGSTISRSATPIPHYPDDEFATRNASGKSSSDKILGTAVIREKRFQYDDRLGTNSTSRSVTGVHDELPKRHLTTKEVIEAAYRHTDEPEKQREIFYPVYVPGSGNMTSPDVIRPSERRGITTPTKKKKKK